MWEAYYVAHDFGLMLFDGVGVCFYKFVGVRFLDGGGGLYSSEGRRWIQHPLVIIVLLYIYIYISVIYLYVPFFLL